MATRAHFPASSRATSVMAAAWSSGASASITEVALEEAGKWALVAIQVVQVLGVHRAVLEPARLSGRPAAKGLPPERPGRRLLARIGPLPGLVFFPVGAQLVVLLALLRVGQNLVGLVDRLELLFGVLIA